MVGARLPVSSESPSILRISGRVRLLSRLAASRILRSNSQKEEPYMSSELAKKRCVPCRGGVPALRGSELKALLDELGGDWRVVDNHHLEKEYTFDDFAQALEFTNRVGNVAEEEGHHPDIYLAWGTVGLKIWTHKIDGLTESDFILAAKADSAL